MQLYSSALGCQVGKRKLKPLLTYIFDSREIRPFIMAAPDSRWFSDGGDYETKLDEGDLTAELDCQRLDIYIERKALNDFLNCCARDRDRFDNELARLSAHAASHIIIESPVAQIRAGSTRSLVSGTAAWHSIAHWSLVYPGIHWWTVTNRVEGAMWARILIQEFAKHHGQD